MSAEINVQDIISSLINTEMDNIKDTSQFEKYLTTKDFKKLYDQMLWGEGPCYITKKDCLVWSDIPNNRMLKLKDGSIDIFRNPSNFVNGNTLDNEGNLISCSHGGRCIYKTDDNMNIINMVDRFNGKKLNSPNDIVVKSNGTIWFTDPPYGILTDYEGYKGEMEYGGCDVFRFNPITNQLDVMSKDFVKPNGIAFSPDEKKIYISDTGGSHDPSGPGHIMVYALDENDNLINGKVFYDFKPFFSDGFRVDIEGNIWTSAGKGIKCINPSGKVIGQLLLPELVSNLEFGGKNGDELFVTATTSLYTMQLNQKGIKFGN